LVNGVLEADVVAATDYYPFGMNLPSRNFSSQSSEYRYGFNGKEKDKDAHSTSVYDYGFRIYNPCIGKFLSVDPLAKSYPWNSTYAFAENDVIRCIDLDGGEKKLVIAGQKIVSVDKDDPFICDATKKCSAKIEGSTYLKVSTGNELLDALKNNSSAINNTIGSLVFFGHSTNNGLLLQNDKGFYKDAIKNQNPEAAQLSDMTKMGKSGEIQFSAHTLIVFASCNTMSDGVKRVFDPNAFASVFGDYIGKSLDETNKDITRYYKVSVIGADNYTNEHDEKGHADGTSKNAYPTTHFFLYEKKYKIERKVRYSGGGCSQRKKYYVDKITLVATKKTDLGQKLDPSVYVNSHDPKNIEIKTPDSTPNTEIKQK
jgi:RHS repeat-associated protein